MDLNHLNLGCGTQPPAATSTSATSASIRHSRPRAASSCATTTASSSRSCRRTRTGRCPRGSTWGSVSRTHCAVEHLHTVLSADGVPITALDDHRPGEGYVTFRCWEPDGTEIEVFWEQER